jgi:hypothetical protein
MAFISAALAAPAHATPTVAARTADKANLFIEAPYLYSSGPAVYFKI